MKMKLFLVTILSILSIFLIYFGYTSYTYTKKYEKSLIKIAKMSDIDSIAQRKIDDIKESLSFGLIENRHKKELTLLKRESIKYNTLSNRYLYLFTISIFIIILLSLTKERIVDLFLGMSAIISLIFGFINPVLMVSIHKPIEYLGDITLSFESKGIIQSIMNLYEHNENIIATIILTFSVIVPIAKSLIFLFMSVLPNLNINHKIPEFLKTLTKWSMIDVFIVAIFLVYIASNNSNISNANIGIGLYYFLIYILVSIITSLKLSIKCLNR